VNASVCFHDEPIDAEKFPHTRRHSPALLTKTRYVRNRYYIVRGRVMHLLEYLAKPGSKVCAHTVVCVPLRLDDPTRL
jgi:hypothetical protein